MLLACWYAKAFDVSVIAYYRWLAVNLDACDEDRAGTNITEFSYKLVCFGTCYTVVGLGCAGDVACLGVVREA